MPKFNCVFRPEQQCPVKKAFKLQPESLVEYCAICHINPTNKPEPRSGLIDHDFGLRLLDMYLNLPKDEREPLLQAIKMLSDIQTR